MQRAIISFILHFFSFLLVYFSGNGCRCNLYEMRHPHLEMFHSHSVDVRDKISRQPAHWSAPEVFGSRAKFNIDKSPASLLIKVSFTRAGSDRSCTNFPLHHIPLQILITIGMGRGPLGNDGRCGFLVFELDFFFR